MPPLLNRRSFVAAMATTLSLLRPGQAKSERAFDIAAAASPIRNFRIESAKSPSDLPGVILAGPPNAGLVLYEFFDYACPVCRNASQELDTLFGPTTDARLGLVQHPVLSPHSADAARVALATARLHGDDAAYRLHVGIFETPEKTSAEKALAVAAAQGLDAKALGDMAESGEIAAILAAQIQRARILSLPATPSFVLGDFAFVGWPGVDSIEGFIEATRRCGGLRCPSSN